MMGVEGEESSLPCGTLSLSNRSLLVSPAAHVDQHSARISSRGPHVLSHYVLFTARTHTYLAEHALGMGIGEALVLGAQHLHAR